MKLRLFAGTLAVPLVLGACAERRSSAASTPVTAASSSEPQGITARGTGRVSGSPDTLTVTIGVENSAGKAVEALSRNAEKARAVIDVSGPRTALRPDNPSNVVSAAMPVRPPSTRLPPWP